MKKLLLLVAVLATLGLSGCVIAPPGPYYGEPVVRVPPPSYNWGYYRPHPHPGYGWGRGWR